MRFPGGPVQRSNSFPSTGTKCSPAPAAASALFPARRPQLGKLRGEPARRRGISARRLEESGATRVVGEDLGTVPDYVRPSLRSLGIAGFKIPQWENYPDQRSIPGHAYERLSVATFATHDHLPLRAMWEEAFEGRRTRVRPGAPGPEQDRRVCQCPAPNESIDYLRSNFIRRFLTRFFAVNHGSRSS